MNLPYKSNKFLTCGLRLSAKISLLAPLRINIGCFKFPSILLLTDSHQSLNILFLNSESLSIKLLYLAKSSFAAEDVLILNRKT